MFFLPEHIFPNKYITGLVVWPINKQKTKGWDKTMLMDELDVRWLDMSTMV